MLKYTFRARNRQGKLVEGELAAESKQAVVAQLREQNLLIIQIEESKKPFLSVNMAFNLPHKKVNTKDLAIFSRQLATMIAAGMPLLRSLAILNKQTENKLLQHCLTELIQDLERGVTLSESMSKHPQVFPVMYVHMVEAGEIGGVLVEVLERMAFHFEKEDEIKEKLKTALIYPAIIFAIASLAILLMLIFVLPTFTSLFEGMDVDMPALTQFIINVSDSLRSMWYLFLLGILLIFLGVRRSLEKPEVSRRRDKLLLQLPIFGMLLKKLYISRFSRTLGTLLSSGVPILAALEVVQKTSSNQVMTGFIEQAKRNVGEGGGLADLLHESELFTPMSAQMIVVGEETGELDTMLEKVSFFYEREVDLAVGTLSTVLEPLIMVVMGVIIGILVLSFLLPMAQMFTTI